MTKTIKGTLIVSPKKSLLACAVVENLDFSWLDSIGEVFNAHLNMQGKLRNERMI